MRLDAPDVRAAMAQPPRMTAVCPAVIRTFRGMRANSAPEIVWKVGRQAVTRRAWYTELLLRLDARRKTCRP